MSDFAIPRTVAHQVPLPMGFSRQEYWRGLTFHTQGSFPTQGSNPRLLCLLHWQMGSLPLVAPKCMDSSSWVLWPVSMVVFAPGKQVLPAGVCLSLDLGLARSPETPALWWVYEKSWHQFAQHFLWMGSYILPSWLQVVTRSQRGRLQSFSASGSFPMSQLFTSGGQTTGASVSVFRMDIQGWFSLRLTDLVPLKSKGLSRVFSSTIIWNHQFFGAQPSLWSNSHIHTLLPGKYHSFDYTDFGISDTTIEK